MWEFSWSLSTTVYLCCHRKYECWVPGRWIFEDPWEQGMVVCHPPKELSSFHFSRIFRATHPQEVMQITMKGIQATPWRLASSCYAWELGLGCMPKVNCRLLPSHYLVNCFFVSASTYSRRKGGSQRGGQAGGLRWWWLGQDSGRYSLHARMRGHDWL